MSYIGDFSTGATINHKFTTIASSGITKTLTSPNLVCYKSSGIVQSSGGITLTADFDGTTGLNHIRITTTNAFYTPGSHYSLVLTTGTVNSISIRGYMVGEFSIANRSALIPTIAGRTIAISTDNEVEADIVKIKGSTVNTDNIVTRIDDEITSRMSSTKSVLGTTQTAIANVKQIKGSSVNTDNLVSRVDVAVSSRKSSTATADITKIKGSTSSADKLAANVVAYSTSRAVKLDNLDALISSRAASSDYTQARAIKLDNLDAAITTRLKSTGALGSLGVQAKSDVNAEVVDVIRTDNTTEANSVGGSLAAKVDNLHQRFYGKVTQSSTTQKVYKDDGASVLAGMTVSATTSLQTKAASS